MRAVGPADSGCYSFKFTMTLSSITSGPPNGVLPVNFPHFFDFLSNFFSETFRRQDFNPGAEF